MTIDPWISEWGNPPRFTGVSWQQEANLLN
jgi:hypothetical protein